MIVKQELEEPESISMPLCFQTPSRTEEYREPTPAVPDSENEEEPAHWQEVQGQDDNDNWSTHQEKNSGHVIKLEQFLVLSSLTSS